MTTEAEGYEICRNETMGHWFIVHRQTKGSVFHRTILAETYESEASAKEAVKAMQGG